MDPIFIELLQDNWIRVLIIYRLWGNGSRFQRITRDNRDILRANQDWSIYKYHDTPESWNRLRRLYETCKPISTYNLITQLGTLDRGNRSALAGQSRMFGIDLDTLYNIFRIILEEVNNCDDPFSEVSIEKYLEKIILRKYPKLPFVNIRKKEEKPLVSIF